MSSVKSITTHHNHPWSNGLVKRRYAVMYTDNLAVDHDIILMPVKVLDSDDGSAAAAKHLVSLGVFEQREYVNDIRAGDAVTFSAAKWNDPTDLFVDIVLTAFAGDKDDPVLVGITPYINAQTDGQLQTAFQKNQAWVDELRARVVKVETMDAAKDDYTPEDIS